ncbi:hypothetical protein PSN45_000182 [Yamadazyma tenuis]|uniref:Subtelomeric hrmA-associated cluster protein AFUB-079030/YDR124W-like helical bundle domain-containing protein n=1 Tax=Candida tenuis (strain ATCC 10573 / BCRC 21748 / CBS 615 / JCM 9827 / NBRC 10315 / NRRL Y-1498 / VKM Y-70) TaxID=590646 RepID=G3BB78_CANTC|nr:uncharacterized protein CANTEDRAFT_135457 [Yamadazyma tenuis ATCC 10573]EGV61508.1 hypothetical protein CANTEDRAFT_135457 [Yamadazyma tenuis ATCC 10573]WEJ92727.1 hypothetical protein PSN45_000182 [Yamadazyma tenuis]
MTLSNTSPTNVPVATPVWNSLSKNQTLMIRQILDGQHDLTSSVFLDIKPCLKDNRVFELKQFCGCRLKSQYEDLFGAMSQVICKVIAKEWIKVICPQKQGLFPYRMAETPSWWPSQVPHVEPDHLDKFNRIELLVSILRNKDIDLVKLKTSVRNLNALSANIEGWRYQVQKLIYELFYLSLYERFYFRYGVNLDLLAQCSDQERYLLHQNVVLIRVSNLDKVTLREIQPNMLNEDIFSLEVKEKPKEPKEPKKPKKTPVITKPKKAGAIAKSKGDVQTHKKHKQKKVATKAHTSKSKKKKVSVKRETSDDEQLFSDHYTCSTVRTGSLDITTAEDIKKEDESTTEYPVMRVASDSSISSISESEDNLTFYFGPSAPIA